LQLAPCRIKGIPDSHIDILVFNVLTGFSIHHQFPAWYRHVDANVVTLSLVVSPVWSFYNHSATHDSVIEHIQLVSLLTNVSLNGLGGGRATKRDLERNLHRNSLL
jgi:hypothetical protein